MAVMFHERGKPQLKTNEFGHLVVTEQGKIISANQGLAELAGDVLQKRVSVRDLVGKTIFEVLGAKVNSTFVGNFLKHRRPFTGEFMIGNRLFQVVVGEITQDNVTLYEIFYFPIKAKDHETNHKILQEVVRKIALQKNYASIDWIRQLSDEHCKQLISCLISHEHSTNPSEYCPYKYKCGFNSLYGWMQLDRRVFDRVQVNLTGELYLKTLQQKAVPFHLTRKKILAEALDLSLGGVRLRLKNIHLPENSEVKLVFNEFEVEGLVVWSRVTGDDSVVGIKFRKPDDEQENNIIKAMIKKRI